MKMPEKHDSLAAIRRQRNKASGQSLRLQWRTFAADIMAVRLQKTVIDATMCAIIAQFIRDLLDFADHSICRHNRRVYRLHRY